ncbi:hypothetical protein TDB9533_01760 [Thalassocella blandensis]|nr:hypothetical protein TDB9533_01760 [Thalassocella blandensis]
MLFCREKLRCMLFPVRAKTKTGVVLLEIDGTQMELRRKKMKYLRVAVKPPHGEVKVSAPMRASRGEIERFLRANLTWIKQQQSHIQQQPLPVEPEFAEADTHFFFGQPIQLKIIKAENLRQSFLDASTLHLSVKQNTRQFRQDALHKFYRKALQQRIPELVELYEPRLGVKVDEWRIKRMKTRWGTCNISDRRIWLNLSLAQYPFHCLEYVVVHEMAHLLERHHNDRFWRLISSVMPDWQRAKIILKQNQFG